MRLFLLFALVVCAVADIAPLYTHLVDGIQGQYIVALTEESRTVDEFIASFDKASASVSIIPKIRYRDGAFKGFAAQMSTVQLAEIRKMPEVAYVEQDSVVRALWVASWGLDRVDQRTLPLNGKAIFHGTGKGTNAYIIDTGVYPKNLFFSDRAYIAYDAVKDKYGGLDCNGHGTHCAGTVGGEVFGIAREANLFGVKVLGCGGSGTTAGVIDGMDFVAKEGERPAVASMSLGGGASTAMDEAVARLFDADVTVSVAAGNSYGDACSSSPARAKEAITVGATDIEDQKAAFSNYGKCVDIFAPGVDIPSLWIDGTHAVNTISGTSMACPHVTGGAILAVGNNPELTSAQVKAKILDNGTRDVVKNPGPESPNLMLYIP
ncbi:uncharacterized protein LOC110979676 [Acanthaster planci]|uniref:Uncharacterized protein LOC110979676 n=1 Tax=Acanthaster planci TaxID=133434 RepID=A0A8B7YG68_ACAPL|nr:uncharacterized protein LOC110979676 [Acanthaster planci]